MAAWYQRRVRFLVYGSKQRKSQFPVDSQLRAQRTKQPSQSLEGPIRANRFADSRESPDSRESFQSSPTEPLFCESRFVGLKLANRGSEAIRANRSNVMKIVCFVFLRIDSCESIRFALRIAGPSKSQSSSKGNLLVGVRCRGVPRSVEEVVRVQFCCLLRG